MKFGPPEFPDTKKFEGKNQGWVAKLVQTIQDIVEDLQSILNLGIRWDEHIYGGITKATIVGGSTPYFFAINPKIKKVVGVWIIDFENPLEPLQGTGALTIRYWHQDKNQIVIDQMSGPAADTKYNVTLAYIGG